MKKNIFFLALLYSGNTLCMNLSSALHTLEKTFAHLKQFLIQKKPVSVSSLLNELESRVQAMQKSALQLDTDFNDLFALQLKNIPLDSLGNAIRTNSIAQEFTLKARPAYIAYTEVVDTSKLIIKILKEIGDNFRKDKLTLDEKNKLITILTKFEDNKKALHKIYKELKAKTEAGILNYTKGLIVGLQYDINSFIFDVLDTLSILTNYDAFSINEVVKTNNPQRIKHIIRSIELKIQKDLLPLFTEIQRSSESEKKIKLPQFYEDWKEFNMGLLYNLETYASFIKDSNLRQQLLKNMVDYENLINELKNNRSTFADISPEELDVLKDKIQQIKSILTSDL